MSEVMSTGTEGWKPIFHSAALAQRSQEVMRLVIAMAKMGNVTAAAVSANVPDSTAREMLRDPEAVRAVHTYREWLFRVEGASQGYLTLMQAARGDDACPWNVRVQASRTLLALGGHSEALAAQATAAGQGNKPLHDMTPDELERLISGASATLQTLSRPVLDQAPEPIPLDITPEPASPDSLL